MWFSPRSLPGVHGKRAPESHPSCPPHLARAAPDISGGGPQEEKQGGKSTSGPLVPSWPHQGLDTSCQPIAETDRCLSVKGRPADATGLTKFAAPCRSEERR